MKMSSHITRIMIVVLVFLSVLFVGITSAGSEINSTPTPGITVEVPSSSANVGETISIPVILNNTIDFSGFMATVNNDIEGVTVALMKDKPIKDGVYTYGSNSASTLKVVEYNIDPIYDKKIHLFTVNVTVNDENVKDVPLKITLEELISATKDDIPLETVVMADISGVELTPGTTLSVESEAGELFKMVETVAPTFVSTTRPTTVASIDVSGSDSNAGQAVTGTSSSGQTGTSGASSSSSDKASTPGFGIFGVLAGLGIAGVVLHQRRNK